MQIDKLPLSEGVQVPEAKTEYKDRQFSLISVRFVHSLREEKPSVTQVPETV